MIFNPVKRYLLHHPRHFLHPWNIDSVRGLDIEVNNHHQHTFNPSKARDLSQSGITPAQWELEALARGAVVMFDGNKFSYPTADEWQGFQAN
ncbi:hypothetical protein F4826_003459 [Rahnella inusitata]|nr:hypothetical protein [Rahnella inusitata]